MKLHALYNVEKDVLMLSSVMPNNEMLGDGAMLYTAKTYPDEVGTWVATLKDRNLTIFSREEYLQMFGDKSLQWDKEAYFIKE